jgi:hypothetical protein
MSSSFYCVTEPRCERDARCRARFRQAGLADWPGARRVRIPVAVLPLYLQMSTFEWAKRGLGGGFGGRLQEDQPPGTAGTARISGPIVDRSPGPSGAGDTIERWHSSRRARVRPAAAPGSRRSQRELRPPAAVSPTLTRWQSGPGKRRRRAVRASDRERRSGGARRAAAPRIRSARAPRSPLAFACSS